MTAIMMGLAGVGCAQDTHGGAWPDLVTARQQDAIDREWVPEFLPEEATDLRFLGRPATQEAILAGNLDPTVDIPECGHQGNTTLPDLVVDWFPEQISGEVSGCDDRWQLHRDGEAIHLWRLTVPNTETAT